MLRVQQDMMNDFWMKIDILDWNALLLAFSSENITAITIIIIIFGKSFEFTFTHALALLILLKRSFKFNE